MSDTETTLSRLAAAYESSGDGGEPVVKKSLKISLQRRKAYWRWCCPRTSSPTLAVLGTVVPECRAEVVGAATANAAPVRY